MIVKSPFWLSWLIKFEIILGKDLDPSVKASKILPYIKEEQKKKEEKEEIVSEFEMLYNRIIEEFKKYPYKDKYTHVSNKIKYKFENGTVSNFEFKTGTLNITFYSEKGKKFNVIATHNSYDIFVKLFNNIFKKSHDRIPNIPLKLNDKYTIIINSIKLRQEELNKLSNNDPKRKSLLNELNVYKKKADELKNKISI